MTDRVDLSTLFRPLGDEEADLLIDDTRSWVDPNGHRLSDRVWLAGQYDRDQIDKILRQGIASGEGVRVTAKHLREHLQPDGVGNYAARRLAQTETSRAFNEGRRQAAELNPFVTGVTWNLSLTHASTHGQDVCEENARGGSFDPNDAPTMPGHPFCRCFWTQDVGDFDTALDDILAGNWDPEVRSAVSEALSASPLGLPTPELGEEISQADYLALRNALARGEDLSVRQFRALRAYEKRAGIVSELKPTTLPTPPTPKVPTPKLPTPGKLPTPALGEDISEIDYRLLKAAYDRGEQLTVRQMRALKAFEKKRGVSVTKPTPPKPVIAKPPVETEFERIARRKAEQAAKDAEADRVAARAMQPEWARRVTDARLAVQSGKTFSEAEVREFGRLVRNDMKVGASGGDVVRLAEIDREIQELTAQMAVTKDTLEWASIADRKGKLIAERRILLPNQTTSTFRQSAIDSLSKVRPMGSTRAHAIGAGADPKAVANLQRVADAVPTEWWDRSVEYSNTFPLKPLTADRGVYRHELNEIVTDAQAPDVIMTHEFGHRVEHLFSGVGKVEEEFWLRRTAGEETDFFMLMPGGSSYGPNEVGRRDEFADLYIGKLYPDGKNWEILTMGMQDILGGGKAYYVIKDEEFFDLIMGILAIF